MNIAISVIIPVLNNKNGLIDTLDSVTNQSINQSNYEVIISDNGSKDGTLDVINSYRVTNPQIKLVQEKIKSSYAARNKAIEKATGPILTFIDADMTCSQNWLQKIIDAFKILDPDYLGSRVIIKPKSKSLVSIYNTLTGFHIKTEIEKNHFAPTCCLSVKKSLFDQIGFFDQRLESGGDWEFGNRVFRNGSKINYSSNIIVYHPSRTKMSELISKTQRVARGKAQLKYFYPILAKDISKNYFKFKNYLPKKPWHIKNRYRFGFSFSTKTVLMFCFYPAFSLIISFFSFLFESYKLNVNQKPTKEN